MLAAKSKGAKGCAIALKKLGIAASKVKNINEKTAFNMRPV